MSKQYYRFLILIFFSINLFAGVPNFAYEKEYILKKDELEWFFISPKGEEKWQKYAFRWTHFDNTNLILLTNFKDYKNYRKQYVLSLRRGLDFVKEQILPNYKNPSIDKVTLFLEFKDFKDNKAKIRVLVIDNDGRVDIEFNKNLKGK
ncbi:hypothetical protein AVBRAN12642_05640 [Campylobacter sp. RM12642]|uniref:hypothetical protein n=1 Tax=unclassified Campylobacter TaxID=2593542 RepID=UPI001BDAF586|nr:hypothetical protein [Campylobacter sp. 2018MI01]MBT0878415.1 hypothetical protein [Campylobacter sp. 2018MI01]MBZ7978280.1 hypothetical protein [Campylobacter sp. RM12654]MBZ7980112.1 hypothetical protein [Campylobacter sp. RM12642]